MEKAFSNSWKSSILPRKQRKYAYNAPLHIRGKFVRSMLSKELRKKYEIKTLRTKKGDKVKILRGQFKGKTGKVDKVNIKRSKLYIENIEVLKKDGSKTIYPINPSNVVIIELDTEDKKRMKRLNISIKDEKKTQPKQNEKVTKTVEKPSTIENKKVELNKKIKTENPKQKTQDPDEGGK